ncbi:alpha/beta hydrolase family protein [Sulfitobacter aestuariivivens]|uniref:Alpha/beta fold hydrolase n=1 Tax=Sulfitobacter aestuariivivens TaxID=2766981 RepID=A0A927D4L2_9RHOB|nr:alpha/beta fold hydrolase [Sulfitobacter aestuariivivens]MBD3662731.1 alpha/beta fold hydrolase [Sulfitobacter aestuariivivens]
MNRIDCIRPDAPALATRKPHPVGVRHLKCDASWAKDLPERMLDVELWYPAKAGSKPGTAYNTLLRDGRTPVTYHGAACRGADVAPDVRAPLVVLSHGYPGNRFLMVHLAEHLASHGFAVAAPDHVGSTYDNQQPFGETLLYRPLDQRGVIEALEGVDGDLGDLLDLNRIGVIGYSMGGYGALILAGAGLAHSALGHARAPKGNALSRHLAGTPTHDALLDPRVKAVIPIGPWGGAAAIWDAAGLERLKVPMLLMAGTEDRISGYVGMRSLFEGATHIQRYLLSFEGAGHNAAAPIRAPEESWAHSAHLGWAPFRHYADPVWDTVRMNNISQHFATAFLGKYLHEDDTMIPFLETDDWPGFGEAGAPGLRLERRAAGQGK